MNADSTQYNVVISKFSR